MQSPNYEILQTKANFPLGEREDFHECKSDGSFKIAYRPKFKLVLLFMFWIRAELTSKHDITFIQMYLTEFFFFKKNKYIP